MTQERAEATLVSLGLQLPRRPTIDPGSDERLTRNRRDVELLLREIDGAMTRIDDAAVERLRLQLREAQQQGIAMREGLVLHDDSDIARLDDPQRLQLCLREIREELDTARGLQDELLAAKDYVQALEGRIHACAARGEILAKKLRRNVVAGDGTHAMRSQESSAVGMGLVVAVTPRQSSLQRPIDQEKKVDPTRKSHHATSPRSTAQSAKSHRYGGKIKDQRQIDLSSVKLAKPVERDDSHIVPASPLSPVQKRATLPTFGEWGAQKQPLKSTGWQTSVQSPRPSTQPSTPRLGVVRKDVNDAITNLVGSMVDATDEQIADALTKLERIESSRQNLDAAARGCLDKAHAARSHAAEMEAQAATLQKINKGGAPRGQETIAALRAEQARRASRQAQDAEAELIDYGSVEEAEKRAFGEQTFGLATCSLDDVLVQLADLLSTPEPEFGLERAQVEDKKSIRSRPLGGTGGTRAAEPSKAGDKLAEHTKRYEQFRGYAREEKAAMKKWKTELARLSEESERRTGGEASIGGRPNL
ncbi:hypothetical protein ASE08_03830 [Rhizobacter sp. Root16D2]|nr:hypothetical protein ASC88_21855 [Rhizobacter sp. Root29]KQW10963.1 hypothetical protein ASC98_03145 [Rhizobacter sp. Root1238]KRB25309.1 hypothetical protein ASE08_03830 [Rhizobacter sp. Root16D2]